jgi:predicted methyltransferase
MTPFSLRRAATRLLASLLTATSAAATADEPGRAVGADINTYYQNADPDRWRSVFESPGREVFDRRFQVVAALDLKPGMDVADIGAGTGLYTLLFARAVRPDGKVYAVDISPGFIDGIMARAADVGVDNVVPVVNRQRSTELPPESIDLAFMADTYHHFEFPQAMLASIHQALRPGGVLAIIDFRRIQGVSNGWVMSHVRAGREQVVAEIEHAGFQLMDEPVALRTNYFLRFRKVDRRVQPGDRDDP